MKPVGSGSLSFDLNTNNINKITAPRDRNSLKANNSLIINSTKEQQPVGKGILENYKIGQPIGQGAYAVVHICIHKPTEKKYAIKIYQKAKLNDSMKRKAV